MSQSCVKYVCIALSSPTLALSLSLSLYLSVCVCVWLRRDAETPPPLRVLIGAITVDIQRECVLVKGGRGTMRSNYLLRITSSSSFVGVLFIDFNVWKRADASQTHTRIYATTIYTARKRKGRIPSLIVAFFFMYFLF